MITCSRPVGQIRLTDRTTVFIFITSGKDGADAKQCGRSRKNRESEEEGTGLAVSQMPLP